MTVLWDIRVALRLLRRQPSSAWSAIAVMALGVAAVTAVFSTPRHLLMRVLSEGASSVAVGIAAGAACGDVFAVVTASYLENVRFPGALPVLLAATVLAVAAIVASLMPAVRAARVDVPRALRSE